ncbi:MAG: DNA polymerase domain-containing protein, partial [Methanobacteriota archaeon]
SCWCQCFLKCKKRLRNCEMKALLVDSYHVRDRIIVWFKTCEGMFPAWAPYTSRIHVKGESNDEVLAALREMRLDCDLATIRDFESDRLITVVEVRIRFLTTLPHVVREIEKIGGYGYRIFNADIEPSQMWMFEKKVHPLSVVEVELDGDEITGISKLADCEDPDFKVCEISVRSEYTPLIDFDCKLSSISFNGVEFSGGERDILDSFKRAFELFDPDVVVLEDGDAYAIDYLLHRFGVYSVGFEFGREKSQFRRRDTKSYFSYGRVVKRPPAHYLKGRLHIDSGSFLYREGGLDGVFELARLTFMHVQKIARLSPGAAITNLQVYTAYMMGYGVPYKQNIVEDFKTGWRLFESDKGGFIFSPEVGFHTDVAEIDFASMYPHIMVNENISGETVLCKCCRDNRVVPELGYHVCRRRRGLTPIILEPIIERRQEYKRLYEKTGLARYRNMANVLKWILVTSFGYMGFRKSRFGRIEAHESITAFARELLLSAKDIAEDEGFEVVHGIVDSLWVKKKGVREGDVDGLCKIIERKLTIPVKNEGIYKWIIFSPSVDRLRSPVPNRYYGVFEDGKVKVRGIELRRADSPPIMNSMQEEMLALLSKAESELEFLQVVPECIGILRGYARRVREGEVELPDLVISKRISKSKYSGNSVQKVVTEKLAKINFEKQPGDSIRYVIRDSKSRHVQARYQPVELSDGGYDAGKYVELLVRATETLFNVFGYTRKEITESLEAGVQQKIWMYLPD